MFNILMTTPKNKQTGIFKSTILRHGYPIPPAYT